MRVGFIGLGRMGRPMAKRVLDAGHELVVYNRSPGQAGELAEAGARVAASVGDACLGREVVVTMVADDAALVDVALRPGGIREALPLGAIHMAMGTHSVTAIRRLAEAHAESGQMLVAAPVLGRPDAAAAGQVVSVAAGPEEAVERCQPLLAAVSRATVHAGVRPESGSALKLANNFLLGCAIEVMGEAFSLVRKYDVDPEALYEVMVGGLFSASAYRVYGRIIVDQAYDEVGFTADLGLKDANLVLAAGESARLPLPSANVWRDRLLSAIAHGEGSRDWAIVAREQARAGGLEG
jgi:3-hydroxyisobutyrate dehydrogenase-like beta-hydroxyacid dehydrogenase